MDLSGDIVLITDSYPPDFGGVARHVHTLSRYLSREGYRVTVLTPSTDTKPSTDPETVTVSRDLDFKKKKHSLEWPYLVIRNSDSLKNRIERLSEEYDTIHYHGTNTLYMNDIKQSTPITLTLHGIFPACIFFQEIDEWCMKKPSPTRCSLCVAGVRNRYYPLLPGMIPYAHYYYSRMKKSMKKLKRIISVSDYVKHVVDDAYALTNIKTIYNFIDYENDIKYNLEKEEEKKEDLINDEKINLLYSGGLKYSKGITTLLESYESIKQDMGINLIISGVGPYQTQVRELSIKDPKIKYLGFLSRSTQIKVLDSVDLFIAPSIYPDACPTSIIEAMSLGKPVIATNVGGIPELVKEGETGHLIEPNDANELTSKIKLVIEKGPESYADHCISQAKKFDIKAVGPEIMKLYDDLKE